MVILIYSVSDTLRKLGGDDKVVGGGDANKEGCKTRRWMVLRNKKEMDIEGKEI